MILANFDLSFFTTIPGMLITGGVLLLLIALIIFIATGSKKDKNKNKEAETNTANVEAPTISDSVVTADVNTNISADVPTNNQAFNTPSVVSPEVVSTPSNVATVSGGAVENPSVVVDPAVAVQDANATPVEVAPQVNDTTPQVAVVNENNNTNSANNIAQSTLENSASIETPVPVTNTPVDGNEKISEDKSSLEEAPVITIVNEEPKMEMPQPEKQEEQNITKEDPKPIYGGASPVIPKIDVVNDEHRPIYGGANPLENTQSIPVSNVAPQEVVNPLPTIEVNEQTVPKEVVEANNETPSVVVTEEPKNEEISVQPVVENTPKVEEVAPPLKKEIEVESLF